MVIASALLAALALALAWPIPIALSRAAWPSRAPAVALFAWQAIALSGALSMIGALVTFGVSGIAASVPSGIRMLLASAGSGSVPEGLGLVHFFALSCAVLFAGHLFLSMITTFVKTERERRRQHDLVALLSAPEPRVPGARVMEYPAPVAYCLPGAFRTATVLTDGLVKVLSPEELGAVVAHERAHLTQQHHLLLLSFTAWRKAIPWFPIATRTRAAVGLLVEMLADDTARVEVAAEPLVSAIVTVATAGGEASAPDIGVADSTPESAAPRVSRLLAPPHPLPGAVTAAILVLSAIVVCVPPVLLFAA
ncbi:Zn-dependent protease with chaperone function [Paramicrobacterium humi]|uniref:Zn-dependent protease with chaperone function n=1 Tax=Paramicrobacterium humi TaxID=640635 RepID=A0A1H4QBC1_9MICO|nr:M56 family metallopeptidase [Microbacterium humi]SEC16897.1 Zn-dependent protease with chaperone function [Microbacterium humi]